MIDIEYKGANCVTIATKNTTVVCDPKLTSVGLKDVVAKDAVYLTTEGRFDIQDDRSKLHIDGPGEYEVGDFSVKGIAAQRHIDTSEQEKVSTMYRLEVDDVRIALLGNVDAKLTETQLEQLGVIDVLIIPVGGGGYTLDATSAVSIVRQIEPRVVIPVHYADDAISYEIPQDTIDVFIKELNMEGESVPKYRLKSAAALPESLEVVQIARTA